MALPGFGVLKPNVYDAASQIVQGGAGTPWNGNTITEAHKFLNANTDSTRNGSRTSGTGGSGSGTGAAPAAPTASQLQIEQINRLLGILGSQQSSGEQAIDTGYESQRSRLADQQTKAMSGYQDQFLKNDQNKQRGVEQVDDFAYNSFNSLQSLLRGANAGDSSVARQLVPQVVSKGAGTRRKGVFDTAGENAQAITMAKGDAEDQFRYGQEDLINQRNSQKGDFLRGIEEQRLDLLGKRLGMEADSGAATDGTSAELNARTGQLQALFGQYAPTYTARAMNLKTPELGQYQVDPAAIRQNQGLPAETRAYLPQIKKKQELER